jgi:hypothetical protein
MAAGMRNLADQTANGFGGGKYGTVAIETLTAWAATIDEAVAIIETGKPKELGTGPSEPENPLTPLQEAIGMDDDYAWGWFCSITMLMQDEGVYARRANERAATFMLHTFNCDVKRFPMWKVQLSNNMKCPPRPEVADVADSIEPGVLERLAELAKQGERPVVDYQEDQLCMAREVIQSQIRIFNKILDILDALDTNHGDTKPSKLSTRIKDEFKDEHYKLNPNYIEGRFGSSSSNAVGS